MKEKLKKEIREIVIRNLDGVYTYHFQYDYEIWGDDEFVLHLDLIGWDMMSRYSNLSEDFIREFQDKVNWDLISFYNTLSEDFIGKFQNKVNWNAISFRQELSENFVRKFQNKVNWNLLYIYVKSQKGNRDPLQNALSNNNLLCKFCVSKGFVEE